MEHLVSVGMIHGKHSRGTRREKITQEIALWLNGANMSEMLRATGIAVYDDDNCYKIRNFFCLGKKENSTW